VHCVCTVFLRTFFLHIFNIQYDDTLKLFLKNIWLLFFVIGKWMRQLGILIIQTNMQNGTNIVKLTVINKIIITNCILFQNFTFNFKNIHVSEKSEKCLSVYL